MLSTYPDKRRLAVLWTNTVLLVGVHLRLVHLDELVCLCFLTALANACWILAVVRITVSHVPNWFTLNQVDGTARQWDVRTVVVAGFASTSTSARLFTVWSRVALSHCSCGVWIICGPKCGRETWRKFSFLAAAAKQSAQGMELKFDFYMCVRETIVVKLRVASQINDLHWLRPKQYFFSQRPKQYCWSKVYAILSRIYVRLTLVLKTRKHLRSLDAYLRSIDAYLNCDKYIYLHLTLVYVGLTKNVFDWPVLILL